MPMDKQLRKLQGRQLLSKSGSGQLVFEDEDSFLALESVQEAVQLSRESGIGIQVDFQEEMIAIHGRRAREVTIYFRVQEGQLTYTGLQSPSDEMKSIIFIENFQKVIDNKKNKYLQTSYKYIKQKITEKLRKLNLVLVLPFISGLTLFILTSVLIDIDLAYQFSPKNPNRYISDVKILFSGIAVTILPLLKTGIRMYYVLNPKFKKRKLPSNIFFRILITMKTIFRIVISYLFSFISLFFIGFFL